MMSFHPLSLLRMVTGTSSRPPRPGTTGHASSPTEVPQASPSDEGGPPGGPVPPPPLLVSAAAWSWRLILVGIVVGALVLLLDRLTLMVLPILAALFFTALLHVPVSKMRGRYLRRGGAVGVVLLLAVCAVGAVFYLTGSRISAQAERVSSQVTEVVTSLESQVNHIPGASTVRLDNVLNAGLDWLNSNRLFAAHEVILVGRVAVETLTVAVITLFLTYFFLAEGDRIWAWLVRLTPVRLQTSINGAGHSAWRALSGWIRGTAVIATFHGIVIGITLWLLGSPLVLPLALLMFLGSFFPIVGALVFGGVAVLVVLLTVGVVPALVLFAVLVVEDQIEAHLLQPFVVGRAVHLHPVTIVLALTAGGALGGVLGAIVVVPLLAAGHAAVKYLTGIEDLEGRPLAGDRMEPMPPEQTAPLPGYGETPAP